MIGSVSDNLEAVIQITVRGPTGRQRRINAVIDTGFNGSLSLPSTLIEELDLPWHRRAQAELADGRRILFDVYRATVLWNRRRLKIHVDQADTMPLVGMELLFGTKLTVTVVPRGLVKIQSVDTDN